MVEKRTGLVEVSVKEKKFSLCLEWYEGLAECDKINVPCLHLKAAYQVNSLVCWFMPIVTVLGRLS